jgi:hypothetical protein
VGVIVLGIFTACLPWAWRNYQTFQAVFIIRSNFGLELRMGNHEAALATFEKMDAVSTHYLHPRASFTEAGKLIETGEIEYMRQAEREALTWIQTHPARFLTLTAERIANLWLGSLKWLRYFPDVLK